MAATAQMVAAVVNPRTRSLRKKIVPAPRKPMPVTICAATRELCFATISGRGPDGYGEALRLVREHLEGGAVS